MTNYLCVSWQKI